MGKPRVASPAGGRCGTAAGRAGRLLRGVAGAGALGLLAFGGHAQGTPVPMPAPTDVPTTIGLVGPGVSLPLTSRLRLQANGYGVLGSLHGAATLVSLRGQLNRYVALTPGYLGVFPTRRADGAPQWDSRVRLDATFTLPLRGLYLSTRQMVERRFQPASVATRYRPLLRLEDTVRLGRLRFTVYAADELFYDGSVQRWTLNLAFLGLTCPFGRRYAGEVFYSRQLSPQALDLRLILVAFSARLTQPRFSAAQPAP